MRQLDADLRLGWLVREINDETLAHARTIDLFQLCPFAGTIRRATAHRARSVVRGTNSGVSLVIGPDGVERERVRDDEGRDRETTGVLSTRVPVPVAERRAARTPYVRTRPLWLSLALLAPLGALLSGRKRPS